MPDACRPRIRVALLPLLVAGLLLALVACGNTQEPPAPRAKVTPPPGLVGAYAHYVALGDSYTAAPYVPETDPADPCLRSSNNYPSLIARSLRIDDFTDRSCGGATTADMTSPQHPDVPPQLTALSKDTDLVTVGIGGNDEKVTKVLLGVCPGMSTVTKQGAPCRRLMERQGGDRLLAAIPVIGARVRALLQTVHQRAPKAEVVLVGYPRIAPEHGTCEEFPLAAGDYAYTNQVIRALNGALHRAARATGTTWVGLWGASKGHDICADDPWIAGVFADQSRAAPYHPFEEEQVAVARLVEQALARTKT